MPCGQLGFSALRDPIEQGYLCGLEESSKRACRAIVSKSFPHRHWGFDDRGAWPTSVPQRASVAVNTAGTFGSVGVRVRLRDEGTTGKTIH